MIDLEQVKKRVEGISPYWIGPPYLVSYKRQEEVEYLLTTIRELIEEVERLRDMVNALSDGAPTYAPEDYCVLREQIESLQSEKAELEAQVCGMREAIELTMECWYLIKPEAKANLEQALSSTPECKHERELMRRIGEESALACEGTRVVAIFKDKQIAAIQADLEAQVCGMREAIEIFFAPGIAAPEKFENEFEPFQAKWNEKLDGLQQALSSMPCKHKEQIAILQAALDKANGKLMAAEFYRLHNSRSELCSCCFSSPKRDERHSWSHEQWKEEARK